MHWQEIHRRLLGRLHGEIRGRWGRISEIEERLGLSGGYLNKLCQGKNDFKLTSFLKTIEAADLDAGSFFSQALEIRPEPCDYLEQLENGAGHDRAWERISRATLELDGSEPPAADPAATAGASKVAAIAACSQREQRRRLRSTRKYRNHDFARAYLEHLDALRYDHAGEAGALAAEVAVHLIPRLPGSQRERLSLQCLALGVFGSARRLKGELPIAARAFRTALLLARREGLRRDYANLLLRASYVLKDFSHFRRALALLNEALVAFVRLGSMRDAGRALVDHGMMNCYAGNYDDAVLDLKQALRHLAGTENELGRYHLAAYQFLAYAFEHLEDLDAAEECLAAGVRSFGTEHAVDQAKLEWLRGSLASRRGDFTLAEQQLRAARRVLAAKQHSGQEALVSLDLVSVMLAQGRRREAADLATRMAPLLSRFKNNRFAEATIVGLISAALAGNLSQKLVAEARAQIEALGAAQRT